MQVPLPRNICLKPSICSFPGKKSWNILFMTYSWWRYIFSYECPRLILIKLIWNLKKMYRFHCVLVYYRYINDLFNICMVCSFSEHNFAMQMFLKFQSSTTINQSLRTSRKLVHSRFQIRDSRFKYLNEPVKSWIWKHVS